MSNKLTERLNEITGVSFVSVTYVNQHNEKHQTLFNVGVDYQRAKQRDIEFLRQLDVATMNSNLDNELLETARIALLESFIKPSKARSEGIANAYTHLGNGLKIHNETQTVYVYGMKVSKRVIEEGNYQEDTRSGLTRAKDAIRALLKSTQYRQFKIENSLQYKISGDTIIFGE
jgi:hypothetical protein